MNPTLIPEALQRAMTAACKAGEYAELPTRVYDALIAGWEELRTAPTVPGVAAADLHLAAQMLTWGREDGLTEQQQKDIEAHQRKLFAALGSAGAQPQAEQRGAFANEREVFAEWHRRKGCSQQIIDDCLSGSISMPALAADLVQMALVARQPDGDDGKPMVLVSQEFKAQAEYDSETCSAVANLLRNNHLGLSGSQQEMVAALLEIAARQPVGEPAIARIPTDHPTSIVEWLGPMPAPGSLLYTAPPAPAAVPAWLVKTLRDARWRIVNLSRSKVPFDDALDGPVIRAIDSALAQPAAPQGVDLGAVRELLTRRQAQWRSHLPTEVSAPGSRLIRTFDPARQGEGDSDYNNDVRLYREGIAIMDEVLALIDGQHQQQESGNAQ